MRVMQVQLTANFLMKIPEFQVKDYFLSRTVATHSYIHIPIFERLPCKTFIVSSFLFIIT
jgi:hypothetical protein